MSKSVRASLGPLISSPRTAIGFTIVLLFFATAIIVGIFPGLVGYNPYDFKVPPHTLLPPSPENPLGTDNFGRSILKQVLVAIPLDAFVAITVVLVAGLFGSLLGSLAGYVGGGVEEVLMRITDMFLAFPSLVLTIGICSALGPGARNAMLALMVTGWTGFARFARADTLGLRDLAFVRASKLSGHRTLYVLRRHILPNIAPTLIAVASPDVGFVLISFSVLGYLGLGTQPPTAELGAIVYQGQSYLRTSPWFSLVPGGTILLVAMGFSFVADGLRDFLDPSKRSA